MADSSGKAGARATPPPGDRLPFDRLDFLYVPSRDVAADRDHFVTVLGAKPIFAIDAMGTRVAAVELAAGPPRILLTDHLEGDRPILIYRVPDLAGAMADLEARGWDRGGRLEIPSGPACSFTTPGGHRLAIYEATRPEVVEHFEGRHDF
jgi:hypothetical protein